MIPLRIFLIYAAILASGFTISFTTPVQLNLYVTQNSTSMNPDGSKTNPFLHFTDALYTLSNLTTPTNAIIYLAYSINNYSTSEINYIFVGNLTTNITITVWEDQNLCSNYEDCSTSASIDFKGANISFYDLGSLTFSGIELLGQDGHVLIYNSDTTLTNIYFRGLFPIIYNSFLNIIGTKSLNMTNIFIDYNYSCRCAVEFASLNVVPEIFIQNVTFNFVGVGLMNEQEMYYSTFLLNFDGSQSNPAGNIEIDTLIIKQEIPGLYSPTNILYVSDFESCSISNVDISDQVIEVMTYIPTFELERIVDLEISNFSFVNNTVIVQSTHNFIGIDTNNFFSLSDFSVINNTILANGSTPSGFYFLTLFGPSQTTLKDHRILNNQITGTMTFFDHRQLTSETEDQSEVNVIISDLTIFNTTTQQANYTLNYISINSLLIKSVTAQNIEISQCNITGTLFSFTTTLYSNDTSNNNIKAPYLLNFTNITLHDNTISDFGFLYVDTVDEVIDQYGCIRAVEPYALWMKNLTVANNSFSKGISQVWIYEVNLIQVEQTQIYLQSSSLTNNSFINYNIILLDQKPSSVLLFSVNFTNNTLISSQFVNSNYQFVSAVCDPVQPSNTSITTFLYRYGYINNSTFSDIILFSSGLFSINNGFFSASNNTFTNIRLMNNSNLLTISFTINRLAINTTVYGRDFSVEQAGLGNIQTIWSAFNATQALAAALKEEESVFFCEFNGNYLSNVSSDCNKFLMIDGFSIQSLISLEDNHFINFNFTSPLPGNIINTNGFGLFLVNENSYINMQGNIVLFNFKTDTAALLQVESNYINGSTISSFITYSSLTLYEVAFNNNIINSTCIVTSYISLSSQASLDNWAFGNNTLTQIGFIIGPDFQNTKETRYSIISLTAVSASDGANLTITDSSFNGIRLLTNPGDVLYAQLNFLTIQTKQNIILSNNIFDGLTFKSQGTLFDFINPPSISIFSSYFSNMLGISSNGLFFLATKNALLSNVTFLECQVLGPTGFIYMPLYESENILQLTNVSLTAMVASEQMIYISAPAQNTDLSSLASYKINLTISNSHIGQIDQAGVLFSGVYCESCFLNNVTYDGDVGGTGLVDIRDQSDGLITLHNCQGLNSMIPLASVSESNATVIIEALSP